jgi:hypothetical protein
MSGKHAGSVVLGIALALSRDDQLGEPGDGTVRLGDGRDGREQVAPVLDGLRRLRSPARDPSWPRRRR